MPLALFKRTVVWGVTILLLAYLAISVFFYVGQESLIFNGQPLAESYQYEYPSDIVFEEITIPVEGGSINALHFKQENPNGVLFFLHGNNGNLVTWATNLEYYQRANYDLFMLDYRGYGKSTGVNSSEQQLHADVRAAWDYIGPTFQARGLNTVIYGRSLGTSVATYLAAQVEHDLLVLVSPFASMIDMAHKQYPWLPSRLLKYRLASNKYIGKVRAPVVFIHGAKDKLIPLSHSEELLGLTVKPAKLLVIADAGHNDIHEFDAYLDGLANELTRLRL